MKDFWIIFVVIFFSACQGEYTKNDKILKAEELLNSKPDSSIILLEEVRSSNKLSPEDYSAWCIQYTHAKYKVDRKVYSDSLLNPAINYYKNSHLDKYIGIAHYLRGCYYRDNAKNEEALLELKIAESHLKRTSEFILNGLVQFNLGYVSIDEQLYNHALDYFYESIKYFKLAKNTKYQAYSYREIANMYNQMYYPFEKIHRSLNLALKYSKQSHDSLNYYSILVKKGIILFEENNFYSSKEYILSGFKYFPVNKSINASYLAYDYYKLNMPDSAQYYLGIALKDTLNGPTRINAYKTAAFLAKKDRSYKKALFYLEKSFERSTQTFYEDIHSQLYRIDKQFNLSEKERENDELQLKNRNSQILSAWLVIILMLVLFVSYFVWNRAKLRNSQNMIEKQRLEHENEIIKTRFEQKHELLQMKLSQHVHYTLEFTQLKKTVKDSAMRDDFHTQLGKRWILTEDLWKEYIDEVNNLYDNFIFLLKEKYQLTKTDLIVVALIFLKVSINDTCILLNMEKNTMYTRRKTIKKRLGLESEVDLEQWFDELIKNNKFSTDFVFK